MDNTRGNALNFGASTERGIMRASTSGNASEPPRATVIVNKDRGNYDEVSWLHLFPSFPPFFFFLNIFVLVVTPGHAIELREKRWWKVLGFGRQTTSTNPHTFQSGAHAFCGKWCACSRNKRRRQRRGRY